MRCMKNNATDCMLCTPEHVNYNLYTTYKKHDPIYLKAPTTSGL